MNNDPSIFSFYEPGEFSRYHASMRAVALFGHDAIIERIGTAMSHETGRIRDYNADCFPIQDAQEQLIIIRSMHAPLILALAESEVWFAKEWLQRTERQDQAE